MHRAPKAVLAWFFQEEREKNYGLPVAPTCILLIILAAHVAEGREYSLFYDCPVLHGASENAIIICCALFPYDCVGVHAHEVPEMPAYLTCCPIRAA